MDESVAAPISDKRELPRSNLFLAAVLHTRTEQATVKVRNMSPRGAMVESPVLPPPGTLIHLIRGALCSEATVIWRSDKQCGVHFSDEVSVKLWMAPPANLEQQRIDAVISQVKAERRPSPPSESPWQRELAREALSKEQVVEDLGWVYRLIDDLAENLAEEPATFARHALKLQNLDIAMQMLAALAKDLADDTGGPNAVSMAKLRDLRVACAQALRSA